MNSLNKLFINSLKNDVTQSFVDSVEAIVFLNGIHKNDFLELNSTSVFTPIINLSFGNEPLKVSKDEYENINVEYDIFSCLLYKLSENFRRIYSARKQKNDCSNLIQQQDNIYQIFEILSSELDTKNEFSFFPRSIFGKHEELLPMNFFVYLGFHDCLLSHNFEKHLKVIDLLKNHLDLSYIPDFLPKLALSQSNAKLLKKLLPLFEKDDLMSNLKFKKTSHGFKIISLEYVIDNISQFNLYPHDFTEIIKIGLSNDVLSSKYFDELILDKNNFIKKLSSFVTNENKKDVELILLRFIQKNPQFNNYKDLFLKEQKQINPIALFKELSHKSFEELNESYDLKYDVILECIDYCYQKNINKNGVNYDSLSEDLKLLTHVLFPCINKQHLSHIISFNSDFMSFCKPIYLNIKFNEKFSEEKNFEPKKMKI